MPDLRDSKFRKELLSKLNGIPEYVRAEYAKRANESALFKMVREYEETSFFSKFLAKFGVGKAAKIEKEFITSGLNSEVVYEDMLKVLNLDQNVKQSSSSAVQEYLTSDLEISKQTIKTAADVAPTPPAPHKNSARPDMPKSPKPSKKSPVYDKVPELIYDKVPPISQYGSVKDLEEPQSASYKIQYGILPSDSKLPFFEAVKNNDISKVTSMLATDKELANARDEKGYTPLHWSLNKEVAALLIANGADVNAKANDKTQPIEWAKNNKELKDFLKDHGGKPHMPGRASHVARQENRPATKGDAARGA